MRIDGKRFSVYLSSIEIEAEFYSNNDFPQRDDIVTDRVGVKVY